MHDRLNKLSLRLRILLFFGLIALGGLASIGAGLWVGFSRYETSGAVAAFTMAGLVSGFAMLALTAWVWLMFDENVARAIERLAGALRTRAHADVAHDLRDDHAIYLGDLAPAARAVTGSLTQTKNALAEAVERETTRLAVENARLQALLADVPAGVLLCSADHQIVFYNGPAQEILSGENAPGLNRSLLDYLRPGPVQAAYVRLLRAPERGGASDLLCSSTQSADVLAGRMRLVDLPQHRGDAPGYVVTLREVTADLALHAGREALLDEVFDRVRRPAANLQTVLAAGAAREATGRAALLTEVEALATAITELGNRYDTARGQWWPMAETSAADLADSIIAQATLAGVEVDSGPAADGAPLSLRCDAVQLVALVAHLAERLSGEHAATDLHLALVPDAEAGALLTLDWSGPILPISRLDGWLARPLEVGLADITGRSVLAAHGSECWPEPAVASGRARLCLPLPTTTTPSQGPDPRRAVYDFDLMDRAPTGALAETRLRDLTCVVFDTETTGLLPSSGDEIVQIAALRMIGGRRVAGEAFDSLVNPGRAIPAASTEVHHITDAMVADAPPIDIVARRFHGFAEGAVLVAHNAPFDLEFLRRHEAGIGRSFDHPVLDTVLLSAVVFGQSQTHTLDALTDRLGITIPPEARHTAMGDTIATAAALEKLIPMLEGRGITTFGETIAAVRRHARLLKDANSTALAPA